MHASLLVLMWWGFFAILFIGSGAFFLRWAGPSTPSASDSFWVGVAVVLPFASLWHLVWPLSGWFWVLPGIVSVVGWWRTWRPPTWSWTAASVGVIAVWVAGHALAPVSAPDAGVYHVQAVRWYASEAVVPGLGNLNPYVAFNHAFFVLPAAMGLGAFEDRGWHLTNGLLIVAALPAPMTALGRLLRGTSQQATIDFFLVMLAARLLDAPMMTHLSGPTADVASLAMGAALLARAAEPPRSAAWASGLLLAALLSMKPASLGTAVAAAVVEWRWVERWNLRATLAAMGVAALALVPWLVHGVVLSGYLSFPIAFTRLPVAWAVPVTIAQSLADWAWAFARWPGHSLEEIQAGGWVMRWLSTEVLNNRDFLIPAGLCLGGGVLLAGMGVWGRRPSKSTLALLAGLVLGLVIWWTTLPDLRFAGVLWWGLAGALLGSLAEVTTSRRYALGMLTLAVVFGGFLGPEVKFRWPSEIPALRPSLCTPTRLATGEAVCEMLRSKPCFEMSCAHGPARCVETRQQGSFSRGFRALEESSCAVPNPGVAPAPPEKYAPELAAPRL